MVNNRQSLSEQSQRRGNLILLIIGIVLLLLFLLALCQMPSRKKHTPVNTNQTRQNVDLVDWRRKTENKVETVNFKPGEGKLIVNPSSVSLNAAVGQIGETEITLKAENARIKLESKELKTESSDFGLSGSCMEKGKDLLEPEEECTILVKWQSATPRQLKNMIQIDWIEDNPRVTLKQKTSIPLNIQVMDSNPCVICKCEEKTSRPPDVPNVVVPINGTDPVPVTGETVIINGKEYPVPSDGGPIIDPETGKVIAVAQPKYAPLNLKNELMGTVAQNREVLDFDEKVIGRLLGDNTIVSDQLEVLGKAIPVSPVMLENGEVIGEVSVDLENKSIRVIDIKGQTIGYPRVDSQVVDLDGKPIAFLAPWGLVMNFNGEVLGGIVPIKRKDSIGMLGVKNEKQQVVGYMRPMGLAIGGKGEVIGGVVPLGVVVGGGCKSHGIVAMNGQAFDSYNQHVGHVLLDKAVVDAQGIELGSVVRQGLVIDSNGKVIGFINSEGKAVDAKSELIGCLNPDGSVFAKEKFVGAVMPEGRVITDACGQVGSVYPDAKVMSLDLQNLGKVLPDGNAVGEKKNLGWVTPWGTTIAQDCQLLGLISLNGTVVSTQASLLGCLTRDKKVQNVKGEIIGMITPTGIQMNEKNQIIGRVSLDGHIINDKGEVLGCVNASSNPSPMISNSTRGVVVDENGFPKGWSFVAGKTYNSSGVWMGDITFNGWVIGDKHQLVGVVPFSGSVFSDRGEIVGRYDQMSGSVVDRSGQSIGRVLPGMTVINHTGTEILGVLIPEETIFVDMQGRILGTLRSDGVLVNQGQEIPAKILANGTMVDEKGKILGARLPTGPVLDTSGKYVGVVTRNGDFIHESGVKAGHALANGLVVSEAKQIFGMVFPSLSTAVAADGWLGSLAPQLAEESGKTSYQGQISDIKGNLLGKISASGQVLGLDQSVRGSLVPIAPYVTAKGALMGWGNFRGEVNNPDGRSVANILPSGLALNPSQQFQGMVVKPMAIVNTQGAYIGHTSSKGRLLSDKGETLSVVGATRFVYDTQGVLLGQLLPPGIALDSDGNLIGWTRYDGQIEDGAKVIGQVGLDGHIFDEVGQMIGVYVPMGMVSFSDANKSLGLVNEKGNIQNASGAEVASILTEPFAETKGIVSGRLLPKSPFVAPFNTAKAEGVVGTSGQVYGLTSRRDNDFVKMNNYTVGSAGLADGAVLPLGSAIGTTLGLLGQVYPDGGIYVAQKQVASSTGMGLVFSLAGELMGGIFAPGTIIDKKGSIVATTGATSAVMSKGKQVGSKMAFTSALTSTNKWLGNLMPRGAIVNDRAETVGSVALDGSVIGSEKAFVGRVLPDGSVAGVPQRSVYNTMPYVGHTIVQGLPLGYRKELLGRTTSTGDVVDGKNVSVGRIRDIGSIFGENRKPLGVVLPFISAVAKDGHLLGTLSPEAKVVSYAGENIGTATTNLLIKGSNKEMGEFDVLGTLIPSDLIVDNSCKVVGQTAYDGRVVNGQGSVVGRIRKDRSVTDSQDNKIGHIAKKGPVTTSESGTYIGRILPDGTMVDLNGVEVACADDKGKLVDITTGEEYRDPETGESAGVADLGPIVDDEGNIMPYWVDSTGTVRGPDDVALGHVTSSGKVVGMDGQPTNLRVLSEKEELLFDPNDPNKIRGTFDIEGVVRDRKGNFVIKVTEDNRFVNEQGIEVNFDPNKSFGMGEKYYFVDCTLFDHSNNKVATLMADGRLFDMNDKFFGSMSMDGKVRAPNGTVMDEISGYNFDLQECGLTSGDKNRTVTIGNQSYKVGQDGWVTDDDGRIVASLENGRLWDLNKQPLDPTGVKPRPKRPEPAKIDPGQLEDIQQKMAEKRQKMRQGLGGAPLTMSAEMQARFKPKKDKNWEKVGIAKGEGISSWPVDMTHVILQGRSIPAVLARSIDSRFSESPALAIVDTNIYAEEGRNILIPAGSQLIGNYSGSGAMQQGVAKVNISWTRLIRPDGVAFNLAGAPSGDMMGRGGIAAYLDEQLVTKYGTAIAGTLAQSAIAFMIATNDDASMSDSGNSSQSNKSQAANDARKAFIDTFGQIVDDWVSHGQAIPPIVYVPIGTRFNVILNQDLWLRSSEDDEEEINDEYGAPTTSAQKPDMPSWEQNRRQQLDDISDKKSSSRKKDKDKKSDAKDKPSQKSQAKQDAENLATPLYDGSDHMQEDLEDRVVEPIAPAQTPPLF